jgi:hypothetical protein
MISYDGNSDPSLHRIAMVVSVAVLAITLVATITGYGLLQPQLPKNPPLLLLPTAGGPVLLPHRLHIEESGAALDCADCHHNEDADTVTMAGMNCRKCHYNNPDVVEAVCADNETHPRCIGMKCLVCHEGEDCTFCHRKNR